jgi:hypothetical protein
MASSEDDDDLSILSITSSEQSPSVDITTTQASSDVDLSMYLYISRSFNLVRPVRSESELCCAGDLLESDVDSDGGGVASRLAPRGDGLGDGPTRWADVQEEEVAMQAASILQAYSARRAEDGEDATLLRELSLREAQQEGEEVEDPLGFG